MKVTKDDVLKALDSLEEQLGEDSVSKASEKDLDQPDGDTEGLGNPNKNHMSEGEEGEAEGSASEADGQHGKHEKESKVRKGSMKKSYMDADHVDESETHSDHGGAPSGKPAGSDAEADEQHSKHEKASKVKKSFSEDLPEEIQTKIDVSNFLKSLVEHTGSVIDDLSEHVAKSDRSQSARYEELDGTMKDILKSQAKIGVVLKAVCERIGIIENAPARAPKADTVAKSEGAERKFASGLAGDEGEGKLFKSLSENPVIAKSQIASAICDLVKKGEASDLDVIGFESGGFIKPELVSKLRTSLN